MGQCTSKGTPYIASAAGGEREFLERYHESTLLGQGEFGVVKLIHDIKSTDYLEKRPLAVKLLKKGYVFRDNILYAPLKKAALQGEVEILRRLAGECYTLRLVEVYESPSMIYIITECYEGGEMMPWVSSAFKDTRGLRTEDVSRISYQLWSAVDHCARHKVIHRDIKPANVMFCTAEKHSQLRLIDFGSGTLDGEGPEDPVIAHGVVGANSSDGPQSSSSSSSEVDSHHTFAGSAFYISPEMFQRAYTSKTDVWSAGATLYVLAAGYPADCLQETFDVLQGTKAGRLRNLPNLPTNMPDSYYDMLEGALVHRHKSRMDAKKLMQCEFSQFHIRHETNPGTISITEIMAEASSAGGGECADDGVHEMACLPVVNPMQASLNKRTTSVVLEGSVNRHNAYLGYQKFERSVTTILATMLAKDTSRKFLLLLREQHDGRRELDSSHANTKRLQVVTIRVLLELLSEMTVADDREVMEVIGMIKSLNNFRSYENFAYHISLLRQFVSLQSRDNANKDDDSVKGVSSVHGNNVWNSLKKRRGLDTSGGGRGFDASGGGKGGKGGGDANDWSVKSAGAGGMRRVVSATGMLSNMK